MPAVALATLAFTPVTGAVAASPHTQAPIAPSIGAAVGTAVGRAPTGHHADPHFTPKQRRAAIDRARSGRDRTAHALRLGDREQLVVTDVQRDTDGAEHVRYRRTWAGLPVVGGDLVVHESPAGTPTTVDWATGRRITLRSAHARTARPAHAREVVYAVHHAPVLAWEHHQTGFEADGTPVDRLVYTDARTGNRLGVDSKIETDTGTGHSLFSGTVSLTTTKSGTSWALTDGARGGHSTYDANNSTSTSRGTLFTDADDTWGNGSTTSRQSAAVDAAYGAAETWDFYQTTFGRNGIANDGRAAYSRVHYGSSYENAFWDDSCFCMTYGDGGSTLKTVVGLDVAGHEMSHGVTAATAGLVYSGDAGGLNEATSDVMGTMVEFFANNPNDPGDYLIGEKVMRDGTWLRRMDNPAADGGSVNCWSTSTKNLDPHYSSGVGNHLFYLLAEGTGTKTIGGVQHSSSTCNGTTLSGIGRANAAAIWYRALTTYWTSTTTYPQAANGMVKAAKDLYGASSTQCAATVAAWKGVSAVPTETCTTGGGGGGGGNLLANPGFESGGTSWSATSGVITNSSGGVAHGGAYYAWLDGYGQSHTDTVSQSVTIPAASSATLTFYAYIDTQESGSSAYDTLKVQVTSGGTTSTRATYSNANATGGYVQKSVDLSAYAGRTITLKFTGTEDASLATNFLLDDLSLTTG